jgi:hypothetical protein
MCGLQSVLTYNDDLLTITNESLRDQREEWPPKQNLGRSTFLSWFCDANHFDIQLPKPERKENLIRQKNKRKNAKRVAHVYKVNNKVVVEQDPNCKHGSNRYKGPFTINNVYDNGTVWLRQRTQAGGAVFQTWNIRKNISIQGLITLVLLQYAMPCTLNCSLSLSISYAPNNLPWSGGKCNTQNSTPRDLTPDGTRALPYKGLTLAPNTNYLSMDPTAPLKGRTLAPTTYQLLLDAFLKANGFPRYQYPEHPRDCLLLTSVGK